MKTFLPADVNGESSHSSHSSTDKHISPIMKKNCRLKCGSRSSFGSCLGRTKFPKPAVGGSDYGLGEEEKESGLTIALREMYALN